MTCGKCARYGRSSPCARSRSYQEGTSSAEFVTAPLDVLLAYFFRAKRCAAIIPSSRRLQWLQARDTEERSEWVTKFREGTQSLIMVVKQISEARDAHWAVPAVAMSAPAGELGPGINRPPCHVSS